MLDFLVDTMTLLTGLACVWPPVNGSFKTAVKRKLPKHCKWLDNNIVTVFLKFAQFIFHALSLLAGTTSHRNHFLITSASLSQLFMSTEEILFFHSGIPVMMYSSYLWQCWIENLSVEKKKIWILLARVLCKALMGWYGWATLSAWSLGCLHWCCISGVVGTHHPQWVGSVGHNQTLWIPRQNNLSSTRSEIGLLSLGNTQPHIADHVGGGEQGEKWFVDHPDKTVVRSEE